MTQEQLLNLPRKELDKWNLYDALDKFHNEFHIINLHDIEFHKHEFEEVKMYSLFEKMFDHRRGVWISLATFKGQNLFITTRAGREGDDHYSIYFFNKELYNEFISYMKKFEETDTDITIFNDECMNAISNFYGFDVDEELFKLNLPLKFQVGDEILASIKINELTEVRAIITKANPNSSAKTYEIELIDFVIPFGSMRSKVVEPRFYVPEPPVGYNEATDERKYNILQIFKGERIPVRFDVPFSDEGFLKHV